MNWVRVTTGMLASSCTPCVESWALCPAEPLSAPCLLTLPLSGRVCKRTGCNLHVLNSTSFIPNKRFPLSGLYLLEGEALTIPTASIEFCFILNYNIKLNRFVVGTMFTHIVPLSKDINTMGKYASRNQLVHWVRSHSLLIIACWGSSSLLHIWSHCGIICQRAMRRGSTLHPSYVHVHWSPFHSVLRIAVRTNSKQHYTWNHTFNIAKCPRGRGRAHLISWTFNRKLPYQHTYVLFLIVNSKWIESLAFKREVHASLCELVEGQHGEDREQLSCHDVLTTWDCSSHVQRRNAGAVPRTPKWLWPNIP